MPKSKQEPSRNGLPPSSNRETEPIVKALEAIYELLAPDHGKWWEANTAAFKKELAKLPKDQRETFAQEMEAHRRNQATRIAERVRGSTATHNREELLGKPRPDPYPSRAVVVRMARAKGVDPLALQELLAVAPSSKDDPGERFWIAKLMELQQVAKQLDALVVAQNDPSPQE